MSRYYDSEPTARLTVCRSCGAVVMDAAAHDRWHEALPVEWPATPCA